MAQPILAQASKKTTPDIGLPEIHHKASCPLPNKSKCVINNPIVSGYTVLTKNVDVEKDDAFLIVDFSKAKDRSSREETLRLLSSADELHVIDVKFPPDLTPAASNKRIEASLNEKLLQQSLSDGAESQKSALGSNTNSMKNSPASPDSPTPSANSNPVKDQELGLIYTDAKSYCDGIQKNVVIKKYAALRKQIHIAEQGGARSSRKYNDPLEMRSQGKQFDTEDGGLKKWTDNKVEDFSRNRKLRYGELSRTFKNWAAECAITVKDTDLIYFFSGSDPVVLLDELKKKDEKANKVHKSLDPSGNLVSQRLPTKTDMSDVFGGLSIEKSQFFIAPVFQGGDNAINNLSKELFKSLEHDAKLLSSEAKKIAAEKTEKEKLIADMKANEQLEIKRENERANKIKSGDYSAATGCIDIAEALDANTVNNLKPGLEASGELREVTAILVSYDQETFSKPGSGQLQWQGKFGQFKTTSKTQWFRKNSISPGNTRVTVVGKYTRNLSIASKSGDKLTIPLIEAACIEPFVPGSQIFR